MTKLGHDGFWMFQTGSGNQDEAWSRVGHCKKVPSDVANIILM